MVSHLSHASWIGLAVLLAVAFLAYLGLDYNQLITLKQNVIKAWSNVDVLLKQRHDELGKLVDVCRQYMQYEQTLLESFARVRTQAISARAANSIAMVGIAESALRRGTTQLLAVAEKIPKLTADQAFANISKRVEELEKTIADRREFYNETAKLNNIAVNHFPSLLYSGAFGFSEVKLLVIPS